MAVDYSRIHRLLKILTLIQGAKGWTPRRLALECGTTERTIYRDMKMLEGAGIPYFFDDREKCYSIRRDFFMSPLQLTLDEALSLAVLAEHIGGSERVPFTKAASRAISKVRGQLPTAIRNELGRIEDCVAIKLEGSHPPEGTEDVFQMVRSSLASRKALRCKYDSINGEKLTGNDGAFILKPYTLFFNHRAWHVVGHDSQRNETRSLKLNRFTWIESTDEPYRIPPDFTIEKHLGNAWRMARGSKSYLVDLKFDAEIAENIADTHWHHTQEVIWHDDNSITFRCKVDGLEEIVWWVLSMGPHCTVKKPRELIQKVKSLVRAMVEKY